MLNDPSLFFAPSEISPFLTPLWTFWSLALCLFGAVCLIFSVRLHRALCVLTSALPWLFGFAMLPLLESRRLSTASGGVCALIGSGYLLFTGVLIAAVCLILHTRKTKISPFSISEGLDRLSTGVCFYLDGGRCVLVNDRMRKISFSLTGHTMRNGEEFAEEFLPGGSVRLPDGRVFALKKRTLERNGTPLYELIAADVTELSRQTEKLRGENERLSRLNAALRAYSQSIGEHVRQNEILRAKMNIHDEMNRLLLRTRIAIDEGDPAEMNAVLGMWQNNALLLCREAEENKTDDVEKDLQTLAESLCIGIVYENRAGRRDETFLRLFARAAREAMINAVKHARAGSLFVSFEERPCETLIFFRNDGAVPAGPIAPRGGLTDLKKRLEAIGGSLEIDARGGFLLTVSIPKGEL